MSTVILGFIVTVIITIVAFLADLVATKFELNLSHNINNSMKNSDFVNNAAYTGSSDSAQSYVKYSAGPDHSTVAVIFIPGLGNGLESFNWTLAPDDIKSKMLPVLSKMTNQNLQDLASQYAETLSFSPPGIMGNPNSTTFGSLEEYCEWIKQLADSRCRTYEVTDVSTGITTQHHYKRILVGHSLGGLVARVYYKMYPRDVRSVVLVDPAMDYFVRDRMSQDNFYSKHLTETDLDKKEKYRRVRTYVDAALTTHANMPSVTDIVPLTELVVGTKDKDEEYLKSMGDFHSVITVDDAGHFIHVEDPEAVNDAIKLAMSRIPDTLYHGSAHKVSQLQPRAGRVVVIDGENAVFAANSRVLAMLFIIPEDFTIHIDNGRLVLEEVKPNSLDNIVASGYIYSLSSRGFRKDYRLGMNNYEFVCDHAVDIISAEKIDNILEELHREQDAGRLVIKKL